MEGVTVEEPARPCWGAHSATRFAIFWVYSGDTSVWATSHVIKWWRSIKTTQQEAVK